VVKLSEEQQVDLRRAVQAAAGREDVRGAIQNVYIALQDAIDLRKPICQTSGRCCHFEEFGHCLFVTTMELAAFSAQLPPQARPFTAGTPGCPFQSAGLCSVHLIRPFGCRIFFCDQTATQWQQEQYERFHKELQRLHSELGVPYFYVEWREALRAVLSV
jgi:hypothetical protein